MVYFSNTTKHTLPVSIPLLQKIADDILDTSYDVSIVVVGDKKALSLNKQYRGKEYIPNVLSFPLDETMGEIFINPKTSKLEAPKFGLTVTHYVYYLLIHSMLHLKGFDHGEEMEAKERHFMKKFLDVEMDL